ncbi:TonB system transport protein ExbD [Haematospirillum sp. H1815]|uniref:TonB system transport protein ExbD n=1 Tax=Haematospirillum sp. H1815 TaxID=2723108 RepID=UPI001438CD9F|nr:TonB system transport protein ExbD [Haematospirillum sp. H1815]NKD77152.1 TonB system transport protein ExbD [Haematospirillum sp. H1815]
MAGPVHNSRDELMENHAINVTPFIDVVLVLLVVFMVAAPLSTVDIPVDLPSSTAIPTPRQDNPVFLTVTRDGNLLLGHETLSTTTLPTVLDAQTGQNREQRIFLMADKAVNYGTVMAVMNVLRDNGYLKIALTGVEGGQNP